MCADTDRRYTAGSAVVGAERGQRRRVHPAGVPRARPSGAAAGRCGARRGQARRTTGSTSRSASSRSSSATSSMTVTESWARAVASRTSTRASGRLVDRVEDLAVHRADVGGVERTVEAQDQQAGDRRWCRSPADIDVVGRGVGCSSVRPTRSSSTMTRNSVSTHADEHGGEQSEDEPAGGGDDGDPELEPAEPPEADELGRLDQAEHGDHDHAAERRLRQVAEHAAEEQGAGDGERDGDELAELGAGAGALVDGGLREPAGRRHRPEERAGDAGEPAGDELLVVVDRWLGRPAHAAGDGERSRGRP